MGWGGGGSIFSDLYEYIKTMKILNGFATVGLLKALITSLEESDWDQQDGVLADYQDDSVVFQAFKELHPDWFEGEEVQQ